MEKFSNWRDGPTGIHPLLPPKSKAVGPIGLVFKFIVGPVIGLVRFFIVLILTTLLLLVNKILKSVPLGILSRVLIRIGDRIFCRLILFFMGFIMLDEGTDTLSRSKEPKGSIGNFKTSDVVICNHSSYIDIIYLQYRYSPLFAVPPNDSKELVSGRLVPLTLFEALRNAISTPIQLSKHSKSTDELIERVSSTWSSEGPLLILPEGSTSNGQGLLEISPVISSDKTIKDISMFHIVGITYQYSMYSPCYSSVGSVLLHLFKVCSQISNVIQVHYLSRSCLPSLPKENNLKAYLNAGGVDSETVDWFDNCFKSLATMINTRRTKITTHDKLSFISKWYGYKTDYSKKSN